MKPEAIKYQFSNNLACFQNTFNFDITEVSELPKRQISGLNLMAICDQHHANVSKKTMLLDGLDVNPPKWCIGLFMKV